MKPYDCIVIGAGAAGLFCAMHAARRGRRTLVIEHTGEPGAKILISGGGRCNFTNLHTAPDRFLSANPHFARSALARYTPADFIALVEAHKIAWYEKTLGQLFCEGAGAARKIVRMLLDECASAEIRTACSVKGVSHDGSAFNVDTTHGALASRSLVLACGGLSIPKIGATDLAHRIARQFALPIVEPRPGLVPLTFASDDLAWMKPLSGISTPIVAAAQGARFREAALFTHRGLSGPAILQASSYWRPDEDIIIDWLPDASADALIERKRSRPKAQVKTALAEMLPSRLADALGSEMQLGDMKDAALADLTRRLKHWAIRPNGTEGYAKAEVTVGGVATDALSQQTMEARTIPGLYVIGEAVDVTGWLGGYNFQWAWASGWCAGMAV